MDKIILKKIILLSASIFMVSNFSNIVIAKAQETVEEKNEEQNNEEYGNDEELTNTFYIPESSFQSEYDYQDYCKRMYNQGYMDENYEWIPEAQDYIKNMNVNTYNILDKKAREIVKERIKDGDMKPEDNPYITYEERQQIINENGMPAETDTDTSKPNETENKNNYTQNTAEEDTATEETMSPSVKEEAQPEEEKPSTWDTIKKVLLILAIFGIVIGAYAIYKRQF